MRRSLAVLSMVVVAAACGGTPTIEGPVPPVPTEDATGQATEQATDAPAAVAPTATPAPPADGATADEDSLLAFTAPLLGGGQLDASTLEGRDVVLWFWAPW